jgi:hypothetical protein
LCNHTLNSYLPGGGKRGIATDTVVSPAAVRFALAMLDFVELGSRQGSVAPALDR